MKIIHVLTTNKVSGAEKVAIDIINQFKNDFEVYYCCPNGEIKKTLELNTINFIPLKNFTYFELSKMIESNKPDIIHAHDFTASVMCSFFSKNIKVISHIHHTPDWYKKRNIKSYLFSKRISKFDDILCVSSQTKKYYSFNNKVEFHNIGNPINGNYIKQQSKAFEVKKEFDLIFIGRLVDEKKPLLFIDLINSLKIKNPNIQAVMIGEGELKEIAISKIKELSLENNISLKGFVNNPYPYLRASKVMISTSEREGFGLSIVESIILETPVIAFEIDGLERFITNSVGKLVPDLYSMEREVTTLLMNESKLKEKVLSCRREFDDLDNIGSYKETIEKFYTR